jgi:hypothetical protein
MNYFFLIHTGPATRGSVQVVILFTKNNSILFNPIENTSSYNDQYNTNDHLVMFEFPNVPIRKIK